MSSITQDFLKEHLEYRDGHLWWIKPTSKRVKVGQQFGNTGSHGYRQGKLADKNYLEHRLIWFYHYGVWPKDQLDHIDGTRNSNRIENLREASRAENSFNVGSSKGSTSQYKGVSWYSKYQKWVAQCRVNGKGKHLGYFKCEHEAAEAYRKATEQIHGNFANYNLERYEDNE